MTSPRDFQDSLNDIVEACRAVIEFVEGMTLEDYLDDRKTIFAVTRGYEIMGEAVRHLPEAVRMEHPEIPWATMTAVRNRAIHAYFGIDDTILFTTIEADLAPLLPRLESLVAEYAAGSNEPDAGP